MSKHPQIQHGTLHAIRRTVLDQFSHVAEGAFNQAKAFVEFVSHGLAAGDGVGVAIDRPNCASSSREDAGGVSAATERAVHEHTAILWRQCGKHFSQHDGDVGAACERGGHLFLGPLAGQF